MCDQEWVGISLARVYALSVLIVIYSYVESFAVKGAKFTNPSYILVVLAKDLYHIYSVGLMLESGCEQHGFIFIVFIYKVMNVSLVLIVLVVCPIYCLASFLCAY